MNRHEAASSSGESRGFAEPFGGAVVGPQPRPREVISPGTSIPQEPVSHSSLDGLGVYRRETTAYFRQVLGRGPRISAGDVSRGPDRRLGTSLYSGVQRVTIGDKVYGVPENQTASQVHKAARPAATDSGAEETTYMMETAAREAQINSIITRFVGQNPEETMGQQAYDLLRDTAAVFHGMRQEWEGLPGEEISARDARVAAIETQLAEKQRIDLETLDPLSRLRHHMSAFGVESAQRRKAEDK